MAKGIFGPFLIEFKFQIPDPSTVDGRKTLESCKEYLKFLYQELSGRTLR